MSTLVLSFALLAGLREAAESRREEFARRLPQGIAIIQSADRSQPSLYEFFVPDTESHDFIYLTGLSEPAGATLVLNPRGDTYREILYTEGDADRARELTGIEHVFPKERFLEDLSSALTDFRNLRITQRRFKPVASDLSRGLGDEAKVIYFNYPRFTNLNEPASPRWALAARLREASPEIEIRDASDVLDRLRMVQDEYGLARLRRAIAVTGRGLVEGMKTARPGATSRQVMEVVDFVYRLNGAGLGFPTGVSSRPPGEPLVFATAREEMDARRESETIGKGELVHFDTGAEVEHYSADVQRVVPADGSFTARQREIYAKVLAVQKAAIERVRPGARWREIHDLAVEMLREAGGWDESYTYGIGHFIGMEVHEHGDYEAPLEPGMVLAIEQGAVVDGFRVAFEDDVLVTANGHEWLTRSIPIEIDEVEALRHEPPTVDPARLLIP